jgi:hypothetical protein
MKRPIVIIDELVAGGITGTADLAAELNRRGIAPPHGEIWTVALVRRVCINARLDALGRLTKIARNGTSRSGPSSHCVLTAGGSGGKTTIIWNRRDRDCRDDNGAAWTIDPY